MAITTQQIAERLLKKSQGLVDTKFPLGERGITEEGVGTYNLVKPNDIWIDANAIPSTPPVLLDGQSSGVVRYYDKLQLVVVDAGTSVSFKSPNGETQDMVTGRFAFEYTPKIYSTNGAVRVFNGDWMIDAETGVITFYNINDPNIGAVINAENPPRISFYKYIGKKGFNELSVDGYLKEPISLSYLELNNLIFNNNLVVGQRYIINDYMTEWDDVFSDYPNVIHMSSNVIEPLLVTAVSNNKIHTKCYSALYPGDVLYYNVHDNTEGFTKGKIYRRIDTINNNDIGTDWRHIKYKRWELRVNNIWQLGLVYSLHTLVVHNNYIYLCVRTDGDWLNISDNFINTNIQNGSYYGINNIGLQFNYMGQTIIIPSSNNYSYMTMFNINITGLNSNTNYYYRAFAVNSSGVGYSDVEMLTTIESGLPDPDEGDGDGEIVNPTITLGVVSISEIINVTHNTAVANVSLSFDGGDANSVVGVCWSTLPNPSVVDSGNVGGAGIGVYSIPLVGLASGVMYYVRAYVNNGAGVAYSSQVQITTTEIVDTGVLVRNNKIEIYNLHNTVFLGSAKNNNIKSLINCTIGNNFNNNKIENIVDHCLVLDGLNNVTIDGEIINKSLFINDELYNKNYRINVSDRYISWVDEFGDINKIQY